MTHITGTVPGEYVGTGIRKSVEVGYYFGDDRTGLNDWMHIVGATGFEGFPVRVFVQRVEQGLYPRQIWTAPCPHDYPYTLLEIPVPALVEALQAAGRWPNSNT